MLNFIHNFELKVNPTFILYTLCHKQKREQRTSTGAKAAHKMKVKLTPGVNFINMLTRSFYMCTVKNKLTDFFWLMT